MGFLDFTRNQYLLLLLVLTVWFHVFDQLYHFGNQLGFNPQHSPSVPIGLGKNLKSIYRLHSLRILFALILLLKNPPLKLLRQIFTILVSCSIVFMVILTVTNGLASKFMFYGYQNLNTAILIYSVIALFLARKFRSETFLNILVIVTTGIFVVENLWELPLTFRAMGHPAMFLITTLSKSLVAFLWFYIFRRVYAQFLRERWAIMVPLTLAIVILTAQAFFHFFGRISYIYDVALRLCWASILIFLPFHQLIKTRREVTILSPNVDYCLGCRKTQP